MLSILETRLSVVSISTANLQVANLNCNSIRAQINCKVMKVPLLRSKVKFYEYIQSAKQAKQSRLSSSLNDR